MSLPYNKSKIPFAKELRKNATRHENHLWYDFLRKYEVRFQRQKTIGGYIADFYCHRAHLVIELDGSQHYTDEGMEYDTIRTEVLNQYGLDVIRFSNLEIDRNFSGVCQAIDSKVKENLLKWHD
ncbi:MAG: endonuclease domain-containing protein [Planctomycetia bacterium]|nr:endonuclease domain-containing protein [Planctomycetia bacterium]